MAEETYITPEIKSIVGKEMESAVCEVEKGAIRKLAESIEDPNPLWQDEEYAKKSRYGSIIASPSFVATLASSGSSPVAPYLDSCPLKRVLNAGNEIEFFQPFRPGDTITITEKLADAYERTGKEGKMVIFIRETTFKNQRGEIVARERTTIIRR